MTAWTAEAQAGRLRGGALGRKLSAAQRRAEKAEGMAFARAWREARRCRALLSPPGEPTMIECGALGWQPCAHRPEGAPK